MSQLHIPSQLDKMKGSGSKPVESGLQRPTASDDARNPTSMDFTHQVGVAKQGAYSFSLLVREKKQALSAFQKLFLVII